MKQIKTIRGLVNEIARREGKKSKTEIGNIREIVAILSDLTNEYWDNNEYEYNIIGEVLYLNGEKRTKEGRATKEQEGLSSKEPSHPCKGTCPGWQQGFEEGSKQ